MCTMTFIVLPIATIYVPPMTVTSITIPLGDTPPVIPASSRTAVILGYMYIQAILFRRCSYYPAIVKGTPGWLWRRVCRGMNEVLAFHDALLAIPLITIHVLRAGQEIEVRVSTPPLTLSIAFAASMKHAFCIAFLCLSTFGPFTTLRTSASAFDDDLGLRRQSPRGSPRRRVLPAKSSSELDVVLPKLTGADVNTAHLSHC